MKQKNIYVLDPLSHFLPTLFHRRLQQIPTRRSVFLEIYRHNPPLHALSFQLFAAFRRTVTARTTLTIVNPSTFLPQSDRLLIHTSPLLSKAVAGSITLIPVSLFLVVSFKYAVETRGFHDSAPETLGFNYYAILLVFVIGFALSLVTVVLLLAKWGLAAAIVGVESESERKWGFGPLRKSGYLLKQMMADSFSIILFPAISAGLMFLSNSTMPMDSAVDGSFPMNLILVLRNAAISIYLAMMMAHHVAANAGIRIPEILKEF